MHMHKWKNQSSVTQCATTTESYASPLLPQFISSISKTFVEAIRQCCKLYLFAAIYTDTPPHVVEPVITPFSCSVISPQWSISPQYDSCSTINDEDYSNDNADDTDDIDDILSQSSTSPGPPSDTSLQGSLNSPSNSSVDGGYDDGDITSSQLSIMPTMPHLVPVTSSHRTMSSDLTSHCPAPSPYDSNADSCDSNDSDGRGVHISPQWTMSPDLLSVAISQQAYDPTIMTYNDVDYVVMSQPSPTG